MSDRRVKRTYDHRLVRLVQETADPTIATRLGVPRSTASGWALRAAKTVVTTSTLDATNAALLARVARLEARVRRLTALLRVPTFSIPFNKGVP